MIRTEPSIEELRANYRADRNSPIAAWRLAWQLVEDAKHADVTSAKVLLVEANTILTRMRTLGRAEQMSHVERKLQEVAALEYGAAEKARQAAAARRVEKAQEDLRRAAQSVATDPSAADAIDQAVETILQQGSEFSPQYLDALLTRAGSIPEHDAEATWTDVVSVLRSDEALADRDLGRRALSLAKEVLEREPRRSLITAIAEHFDARMRAATTDDELSQLLSAIEEQLLAMPGPPVFHAIRIEILGAQLALGTSSIELRQSHMRDLSRTIQALRHSTLTPPLTTERVKRLSELASRLPHKDPLGVEVERLHFYCVRSLQRFSTASPDAIDARRLLPWALWRLARHQENTNHPDADETFRLVLDDCSVLDDVDPSWDGGPRLAMSYRGDYD